MKSNQRSDVEQLRLKLISANSSKDAQAVISVLKEIIVCMMQAIDVSALLPDVIREASSTTNMVQKKLVYFYICTFVNSNNADLALLIVNTLVKDARHDPNPMVRGLALRSISNIRLHNLVEHMKLPLLSGLRDDSCYVRRNAVLACAKFYKLDALAFAELNLQEKLEEMLYDVENSFTVLCALHEVMPDANEKLLTSPLVFYFFERLSTFNEWAQCYMIEKFAKFVPSDEEECLCILNLLDDRLKHSNQGVVMATVNLFLQLSKHVTFLRNDILDRIRVPILSIISTACVEIVYFVLSHVMVLVEMKPRLFHKDYKLFYLRNKEPCYVRHKKIEVLTKIITEGNMNDIVAELKEYIHDSAISRASILAIGQIATSFPFTARTCVASLMSMLDLGVESISSSCAEVAQELLSEKVESSLTLVPKLEEVWDLVQDYPKGKAALVWIYGEYAEDIEGGPYYLEGVIDSVTMETCVILKLNLLTAMMKLFFKRPPECRAALGRLLESCIKHELNTDVKERATFYYRLLSQDIELAKNVVLASQETLSMKSVVTTEFDEMDFRFQEFNTMAIVYNKPSYSFIKTKENKKPLKDGAITDLTVDSPNTVAVADLLGVEDSGIRLSADVHLDDKAFEKLWHSAKYSEKATGTLIVMSSHEDIIANLKTACFQRMASSPAESREWKFYFYAQKINCDNVILTEMFVSREGCQFEVHTKCDCEEDLVGINELLTNAVFGESRCRSLPST